MKFSDEQLAKYSNAVWGVVVEYPAGTVVAEQENLDVDGHIAMVRAVAEAAVTDVLDRIDDAMDELSYAARWEHKDERAVGIWVDAINLVRSFYPTPAPTADEEGDAE